MTMLKYLIFAAVGEVGMKKIEVAEDWITAALVLVRKGDGATGDEGQGH